MFLIAGIYHDVRTYQMRKKVVYYELIPTPAPQTKYLAPQCQVEHQAAEKLPGPVFMHRKQHLPHHP